MSLMPKSECIPTFEFKTTFTRPPADGEPPDVRVKSSKSKFSKQELLEFFVPLLIKWQKDIAGMYECELPERGDVIESCRIELKNYIKQNGGE